MFLNKQKCPNCESYYDPTLQECPKCHKSNELYSQRDIPSSVAFFHPAAQIGLFLAGFAYFGMLFSQIITNLIFKGLDKTLSSALVLFFSYLMMLGALLTIVFSTRRTMFFKKFTRPHDYLFGLAYAGGILGAGIVIGAIVNIFYQGINDNQSSAINFANNYPLFAFFVICIFGPICEELTYRVGLYSFLRRINKVLAMVVTVLVFAFIHFDFTAENIVAELWSLPSYIACGLILTIAYEHRGPACSISAHMIYNSVALAFIYLGQMIDG